MSENCQTLHSNEREHEPTSFESASKRRKLEAELNQAKKSSVQYDMSSFHQTPHYGEAENPNIPEQNTQPITNDQMCAGNFSSEATTFPGSTSSLELSRNEAARNDFNNVDTPEVPRSCASSDEQATEDPCATASVYLAPRDADIAQATPFEITRRLLGVLCKNSLINLIMEMLETIPDLCTLLDTRLEQFAPCRRLMVRNINFTSEPEDFREFFRQFGNIDDSTIVLNKETKKSKGFGFVTFKHIASVREALKSPLNFHGRALQIKLAAATVETDEVSKRPTSSYYLSTQSDAISGQQKARRKLFLRNLGPDTTAAAVRAAFEDFGEVEDCVIITNHATGKGKGYGFITFSTAAAAENAIKVSQRVVDDRVVFVTYASTDHAYNKKGPHAPMASAMPNQSPPSTNSMQISPLMYHMPLAEPERALHSGHNEMYTMPLANDYQAYATQPQQPYRYQN